VCLSLPSPPFNNNSNNNNNSSPEDTAFEEVRVERANRWRRAIEEWPEDEKTQAVLRGLPEISVCLDYEDADQREELLLEDLTGEGQDTGEASLSSREPEQTWPLIELNFPFFRDCCFSVE
jgi:hypothetical protein